MDACEWNPDADARPFIRKLLQKGASGWSIGAVLLGEECLPRSTLLNIAPPQSFSVGARIVRDGVVETQTREISGIPVNLLRIDGGYVVTDAALAVTESGSGAHIEADGTYDVERFSRRALHRKNGRIEEHEHVFVLTTQFFNNYSHWLTQVCASAALMLEFCADEGIIDPIFVVPFRTSETAWKMDSLVAIGVPRNAIVNMGGSILRARHLYYCSLEFSGTVGHTRTILVEPMSRLFDKAIAEARRSVPAERQTALPRRVFVDRSLSVARPLSNSLEVYGMAADFGMTSLKLESLSFLEQICLFAKADLIVAEHGAGLTNLLFSSDCRVVELLPSGFGNWAYPAIAALKQVEFNRVIGSSMTSLEAGRIWSIDAVSLRTALQQLSV